LGRDGWVVNIHTHMGNINKGHKQDGRRKKKK